MPGDLHIFQPVFVGVDDHIGGNGVAGLQLIDLRGRLERVGHNHLVHEARYGFVIDIGRVGVLVNGDDFSSEGIAFASGLRGRGFRLRLCAIAGAG